MYFFFRGGTGSVGEDRDASAAASSATTGSDPTGAALEASSGTNISDPTGTPLEASPPGTIVVAEEAAADITVVSGPDGATLKAISAAADGDNGSAVGSGPRSPSPCAPGSGPEAREMSTLAPGVLTLLGFAAAFCVTVSTWMLPSSVARTRRLCHRLPSASLERASLPLPPGKPAVRPAGSSLLSPLSRSSELPGSGPEFTATPCSSWCQAGCSQCQAARIRPLGAGADSDGLLPVSLCSLSSPASSRCTPGVNSGTPPAAGSDGSGAGAEGVGVGPGAAPVCRGGGNRGIRRPADSRPGANPGRAAPRAHQGESSVSAFPSPCTPPLAPPSLSPSPSPSPPLSSTSSALSSPSPRALSCSLSP